MKTLQKEYEECIAPGFQIVMDDVSLDSAKTPIISLEVELTADGTASGCRFSLECMYNYKESKWDDDLQDKIKVGSRIVILTGYVIQKQIFVGYVDEFSLHHDGSGPPRLEVSGIDGLGYLMGAMNYEITGQKPSADIVGSLFDKAISAGYAVSKDISIEGEFGRPLLKEDIDDYQYLRKLAEHVNVNLLVSNGEMIFKDLMKDTTPVISLTLGKGLLSFEKRLSLKGQVGKVEVHGWDVNNDPIEGSAESVSVGGSSGKTAAETAASIKELTIRINNAYVQTEEECASLAQAKLNSIASNFVFGRGVCVGLPEIIAGRYIEILGTEKNVSGTYFLNKVTHKINESGYVTEFEVKGAKG